MRSKDFQTDQRLGDWQDQCDSVATTPRRRKKRQKSKAYKVYRPIAGQRQRDEAGIEEDCEYEYEVDNRKEQ